MIDLNLLIKLSDTELEQENDLILRYQNLKDKISEAIKGRNDSSKLLSEQREVEDLIRENKGNFAGKRGYKVASNSSELAKALIKRSEILGKLEHDAFSEKIAELKKNQEKKRAQIDDLIVRIKRNGLNKKVKDLDDSIEFWELAKVDVFSKKGEELAESWAYLVGQKYEFSTSYNYVNFLIKQLRENEEYIVNLYHQRNTKRQSDHFESACRIVMASDDDNKVFREIFLMGQYASNLNNLELELEQLAEIKRKNKASKDAASRSDWAKELALLLYLDYWIFGKVPNPSDYNSKYPHLTKGREARNISKQMTEQRRFYANVDSRVDKVASKGRKPKV